MGAATVAPLVLPAVLTAARIAAVRTAYYATRPWAWGLYNIHSEYEDLKHLAHGDPWDWQLEARYRPIYWQGWMGRSLAAAIPYPWLALRTSHPEVAGLETTQSPPPLHQGNQPHRPSKPTAVSLPNFKRPSKKGSRSRKRCPPGHYWNGRRCVKR